MALRKEFYFSYSPGNRVYLHAVNLINMCTIVHDVAIRAYCQEDGKKQQPTPENKEEITHNHILIQLTQNIHSLAEHIKKDPNKETNKDYLNLLVHLRKTLEGDNKADTQAIININQLLEKNDAELKKMRPYLEPVLWGLLVIAGLAAMIAVEIFLFPHIALTCLIGLSIGAVTAFPAVKGLAALEKNLTLQKTATLFSTRSRKLCGQLEDGRTAEAIQTIPSLLNLAAAVR